jgi:hypothetical protein
VPLRETDRALDRGPVVGELPASMSIVLRNNRRSSPAASVDVRLGPGGVSSRRHVITRPSPAVMSVPGITRNQVGDSFSTPNVGDAGDSHPG